MMIKKATYTLWNGSELLHTYPHTREGYTAALEQAADYGGYWLKIFSSRWQKNLKKMNGRTAFVPPPMVY